MHAWAGTAAQQIDGDVRIYVSLHCSEGVLRISSLNNQLLQHILMSLKASIEVAINWSDLRIKDFSRQGYVRYSTSVHYSTNPATAIYFMPYSLIPNHLLPEPSHQSQIDHEAKCCYSRLIEVQYFNQHPILENQTCCFKGYVDLRILPKISLFLTVELLFTEDPRANFSVLYTSTLLIRKFPNVFAFIPLHFDDHQALQLCGTLQSTVMEYRFQSCEEECHSQFPEQWESIDEYFGAVTHQYQYNEVLKFFKSHRRRLQESMIRLEEDHNAVLKLLRQQDNSKFMKLMANRQLEAELEKMYSKETVTLSPEDKHRLLELILKDFLAIKVHIYERLNTFNALIHAHSGTITNHLQQEYQNMAENRLRNSLSTITFESSNWTFSRFQSSGQKHLDEAPILRNNLSLLEEETRKAFALEEPLYFGKAATNLHIFQEVYQTSQPQLEFTPKCEHIVFLVHGFQGSKADLSAMKYYLEAKHALTVHISTANAGRTEESLNVLGVRLAIQVNRIVDKKKNFMMSFIGHSMGGLIILSAMSSLKSLWPKMHSYTSIGTPHLGYLYAPSNIVKVGLWLMNSLQECESITEICMQDSESPKDCFLYRLACSQQLCHFRKVSFIASPQDQYVPYESARVEKNSRLLNQLNQSGQVKVICDMVDGMLGKITASKITRVSVVFHIEESNLNSFIGRVAHIKFLNDQHFIRHFVITLKHLFL